MVKELIEKREVTSHTRWSEFVKKYKDDERYYDLVGQSYPYISQSKSDHSSALFYYGGSTPKEIFEDLIEEELNQLKRLKPIFRSLVKENGVKFPDRSKESFNETLSKYKEYTSLTNLEKEILYEYYLQKLREK